MANEKVNIASLHPYADFFEEFCRDIENWVVIPVCQGKPDIKKLEQIFSTLGDWDSFKTVMQEMLDDESYYKDKYDEQEKDKELAEETLAQTQIDIKEIMEDIQDLDNAEIPKEIDLQIQTIYEKLEIEEYDEDNSDWLVCTDSEADDKWEQELDNYIEECIYPELSGTLRNYFDEDKWKTDARYDGRGHSLAKYDGHECEQEIEGTTYYLYKQN